MLPGRIPEASAMSRSDVRIPDEANSDAAVSRISSRRALSAVIARKVAEGRIQPLARGGCYSQRRTDQTFGSRLRYCPAMSYETGQGGMSDLMTPELARAPQPTFRAILS